MKSATPGRGGDRSTAGREGSCARRSHDEWGSRASRESVDATRTEILRLKHECGATDRAIARSLGIARSTVAVTLECLDAFRWYRKAVEFGEDRVGGFGPDERFGIGIVLGQISVDGGLEVDDRAEDAAADALAGDLGKEVLDRI